MNGINSFRDLTVWQKSFQLAKDAYKLSAQLPKAEQFGLISQLRRCAVSIPSNIAEGQQRNNRGEFKQFLGMARGSAAELETQILLTRDIYQLPIGKELALLDEVQKMLSALIAKLSTDH